MRHTYFITTPVGPLGIVATDEAVVRIFFAGGEAVRPDEASRTLQDEAVRPAEAPTPLLAEAARELEAYFAGTRRTFDFPVAPEGTAFQQRVWEALRRIPYGQTRSYRQIAEAIGRPAACRAVGMANNRNPLAIVIPCHRVVGADGSLTGYAGGLEVKARLLELEQNPR